VLRLLVAALSMTLIVTLGPGSGSTYAHAVYVRSEPPFNAVLDTAPAQVKVWLTQEPATAGARIKVMDQMGRKVDKDDTKVSFDDPKMMSVSLNNISEGSYLVEWAVVSAEDGDPSQGSFTFSVGSPNVGSNAGNASPALSIAAAALAISILSLGISIRGLRGRSA